MPDPKLTGILGAIGEVAGIDAAVRFSMMNGGRDIRIPAPDRLHDDHPLMELDRECAIAVARRFQGETVYVPLARGVISRYLFEKGASVDLVAARLGISKRTAYRYKSKL